MSEVTVSQEFIDKAIIALNKSAFWEFADCPSPFVSLCGRRSLMGAERIAQHVAQQR